MAANWSAPIVQTVTGLVVEGVVGDDGKAQPGQPPLQRPADGTETHQPGRAPGEFGAPEPLIRDGAVAKYLPGPDVGVRAQ
jgi:hypothetical protein